MPGEELQQQGPPERPRGQEVVADQVPAEMLDPVPHRTDHLAPGGARHRDPHLVVPELRRPHLVEHREPVPLPEQAAGESVVLVEGLAHRQPLDRARKFDLDQVRDALRREERPPHARQAHVPEPPVERRPERVERAHHAPLLPHLVQQPVQQLPDRAAPPRRRMRGHRGDAGHVEDETADVLLHREGGNPGQRLPALLGDQAGGRPEEGHALPILLPHAGLGGRGLEGIGQQRVHGVDALVGGDLADLHGCIQPGSAARCRPVFRACGQPGAGRPVRRAGGPRFGKG
jgi:hypothetical protein